MTAQVKKSKLSIDEQMDQMMIGLHNKITEWNTERDPIILGMRKFQDSLNLAWMMRPPLQLPNVPDNSRAVELLNAARSMPSTSTMPFPVVYPIIVVQRPSNSSTVTTYTSSNGKQTTVTTTTRRY